MHLLVLVFANAMQNVKLDSKFVLNFCIFNIKMYYAQKYIVDMNAKSCRHVNLHI